MDSQENEASNKPVSRKKRARRLNDLQPRVDYLEPKFLPRGMPDHLARLELWKACERLGIPKQKWPRFDGESVILPGPTEPVTESNPSLGIAQVPLIFTLPAFDLAMDAHRGWRTKVRKAWREFCLREFGPHLKKCTRTRERFMVKRSPMRFNGRKRDDAIPAALRYELAVRRYCFGETWLELQEGTNHSADRISKSVRRILESVGLTDYHKRLLGHD